MSTPSKPITKISLERPASVRKFVPSITGSGWLLPEYLVGPENSQLEYLFNSSTIAELEQISPVVLLGEPGTGKTALSISLAVEWSRALSRRPLCFTTGATFMHDFAAAVEIDDTSTFRSRHRDCQLLVVDQLEALARSAVAQQELALTLDYLIEQRKPIIINSTRLPASISDFSPALCSRLSGGYSLQLDRPGVETATQIVTALCGSFSPKLPAGEIRQLLPYFRSLKLTAADLKSLVVIASQNMLAPDRLDSATTIKLAMAHFQHELPSIADIAKTVARKMHVRLTDVRGSTRQANIVRARGLAIYLARQNTPNSLQAIGQFFGGRDHSTVLHACRKTESLLASDSELANVRSEVDSELKLPALPSPSD